MTPDTLTRILISLWIVALAALLVRMLLLRLHHRSFLFVVSVGLGLVFSAAALLWGFGASGIENLGLLGDTMDVILVPFIALELFGTKREQPSSFARELGPVIGAVVGAAMVMLFLLNSPDTEELGGAAALAFLLDTAVTVCLVFYTLPRLSKGASAGNRNLIW